MFISLVPLCQWKVIIADITLAANGASGSEILQSHEVRNIEYSTSFKCLILEWCHSQAPTYRTVKFGGFCGCGEALYVLAAN